MYTDYIKERLQAARALIADPAHWTQDAFARDANQRPVGFNDTTAVCWCGSAALDHVVPNLVNQYNLTLYINQVVARLHPGLSSLVEVNDILSHAHVIAVYDAAIDGFDPTAWAHWYIGDDMSSGNQ